MNLAYRLILASKSPRRQKLLRSLEVDFEIRTKDVDEDFPEDLDPNLVSEFLAIKKSEAFDALAENELILTSDTTVICNGKILNKAADYNEAFGMIEMLSGKSHEVITGVCLRTSDQRITFSETTKVTFATLTTAEIDHYIKKYQPFDKAGAYGIQEWIGMIGIEKIEGDFYNVMGLPLHRLYRALLQFIQH
ncbi:MAG: septum formation protein Maf [Cytophagales bacterium CG12_big_fil_rev_8_21_14_0_65_40_12]|nr:MAG: septum formation protein Maf [Cytophagales bacterium CG12_big_fil_rev_8_21_14_0_65_40_12]PIW05203.1 MAG: septum formation protein Maf [Cytophagales bacterium CG17_big_fil_post_rev_8_21_14_2_50_40_13]